VHRGLRKEEEFVKRFTHINFPISYGICKHALRRRRPRVGLKDVAPPMNTFIVLSECTNLKSYSSRTFVETQSSDYITISLFISVLFI
jgi:hypothetical protein